MAENHVPVAEKPKEKFYGDAKEYWEQIPATVNGMLGGYAHISSTDISGSSQFLRQFTKGKGKTKTRRAVDCGAGIGRITKLLLVPMFESVDMVELNQDFLNQAQTFFEDKFVKVDKSICCGLQEFVPEPGRYDLIWCQWVLGHLTDQDFIDYLNRCKIGLAEDGIMVIKENMEEPGKTKVFDSQDSSFTRSRDELVSLIERSDLDIIKETKQKHFPKEIYEVRMFALQ